MAASKKAKRVLVKKPPLVSTEKLNLTRTRRQFLKYAGVVAVAALLPSHLAAATKVPKKMSADAFGCGGGGDSSA